MFVSVCSALYQVFRRLLAPSDGMPFRREGQSVLFGPFGDPALCRQVGPPLLLLAVVLQACAPPGSTEETERAGNPVLDGWYADPEALLFEDRYWIYPTYSAPYHEQVFFDAFSSPDLVHWTKHPRILDTMRVAWADSAMWAPSAIEKDGRYYFFFAANDIQRDGAVGGIGIAVSDSPAGPFEDYLGKPLIDRFINGAQPIDQFVFRDVDGQYYIVYGGWGHANIARLKEDFTGLVPFEDGTLAREITPEGYVEGPILFRKDEQYYFMWSEGAWTRENYRVAYGIADSPFGPFERIGTVLEQDATIATGAGHHSVLHVPESDAWYIVYHRRPIPNESPHHRVTAIDRMYFNPDGTIQPIEMTFEGVAARPLD
jgi:beta-xylosidase